MVKQLLRSGADSELIAQATIFGWALSGPVRRKNSSASSISTHHHLVRTSHHNQIPLPDHRRDQVYLSSLAEEEAPSYLVEEQVRPHSVNVTCSSSDLTDQETLLRKPEMQPVGDSQTQSLSRHIQSKRTILSKRICDSIQEEAHSHSLNPAEPEPASEPSSSHQPSSDSSSTILPADLHQISLKQPPKVESILQSTPQNILYLSVKTTQQTVEDFPSAALSTAASTAPPTAATTVISTVLSTELSTIPSAILPTILFTSSSTIASTILSTVPSAVLSTDLSTKILSQQPQFYNLSKPSIIKQTLQAVSDSSLTKYGTTIYCRVIYPDHPPSASLISAEFKSTHINSATSSMSHQIRHDRPNSTIRSKHLPGTEIIWHCNPKEPPQELQPPQEPLPPGVCLDRNPPSTKQQRQPAAKQPAIT